MNFSNRSCSVSELWSFFLFIGLAHFHCVLWFLMMNLWSCNGYCLWRRLSCICLHSYSSDQLSLLSYMHLFKCVWYPPSWSLLYSKSVITTCCDQSLTLLVTHFMAYSKRYWHHFWAWPIWCCMCTNNIFPPKTVMTFCASLSGLFFTQSKALLHHTSHF